MEDRFRTFAVPVAAFGRCLPAQDRNVDPTWLHRFVPQVERNQTDLSSATCHYKPIFGRATGQSNFEKCFSFCGSFDRCPRQLPDCLYDREEEIYFVLQGTGTLHYGGRDASPARQ